MYQIIDLSNNNPDLDFKAVKKAGITGVYLKASEGISFTDDKYPRFRKEALAAGLRVGSYHFGHPAQNPVQQADHFAKIVGKLGRRDFRPVLDLEVTDNKPAYEIFSWIRWYNARIHQRLGVWPIFYSYPDFIHNLHLPYTVGDGLWLADYGVVDPSTPLPWHHYVLLQYTDKGKVNGVSFPVDRSEARKLRPLLAHPNLGLL